MDYKAAVWWYRLNTKAKITWTGVFILLTAGAVTVGGLFPTGEEGKLALRAACASVTAPMSPATLHDHFPRGTYTPQCVPGTDGCTAFKTRDDQTQHYPCRDGDGDCVMYWRADSWGCRVRLSNDSRRAQGPGDLQNTSGTWKSLAD
jgi:hypothetical protein